MADAESDEPVVASNDGVTVEKSFEPDDFPVPAIAFTVRSERQDAVSVRLIDTVPDDIPTEDIGFHPKYGAEFWDVEGDTIVFNREFEPNEEYVTVYGLRGKDATDVERFLTEPTVDSVTPLNGDSSDVVRDVIDDSGGGAQSAVTSVDSAGSAGGADVDIDLPDPGENDGAVGTADPGGSTAATGATTAGTAAGGSVAATLAEEIRAGEVDDDDLDELRDALGVTPDGSTEARIESLQNKFADLEAYTGALEEFLDEEGDAQSLIEDVRDEYEETADRLDEATDQLADVESELEELWTAVDDGVEEELEMVRDDLEAFGEDLEAVRDDLETVESELASETDSRLESMEADIDRLEDELADVAEMRDRLATALGGLAGQGAGGDGGSDTDETDDADETADAEDEEMDLDEDDEEIDLDGGNGEIPDDPEIDLED